MQFYFGDVIYLVGWFVWNEIVGFDTVFYGEFENYGFGVMISMRV